MSHTSIPSFTQAAQQAQQWVNELSADLNWNEQRAYGLLRAVLHTIRDWLSLEEAADLSAQLPLLVRGIYFEAWNPSIAPVSERSKHDFILSLTKRLGHDTDVETDVKIDKAITAVFGLLDRHISHGEIVQVRNSMKKPLRQLWPGG